MYKKNQTNAPLQPWRTSRPMTCVRDMAFHVLYGSDKSITQFYVLQSMDRLGAEWDKQEFEPDVARALFFLLLDKDMALKEAALKGIPQHGVEPMTERKAENFFLSLREEAINPWLCNEQLSPTSLLDAVASLYWAC